MVALWIRAKPLPVTLILRPPLQTAREEVELQVPALPSFLPSSVGANLPHHRKLALGE